MPNWNAIAERIARGQYGDQWAKEDAAAQDLEAGKLRMELARSGESRAQEQQGWERGKQAEFEANRGIRDQLAKLGLSKAEQDVIIAQQNAAQEKFVTGQQPVVAKRAEETHARQGKELGLRERELGMREADWSDIAASRKVNREASEFALEEAKIEQALKDIARPELKVAIEAKRDELNRLISSNASLQDISMASEELESLINDLTINQQGIRETRARARRRTPPGGGVLMNQGQASPYDIFK